jgi:hypothetical protein
MRIRIKDIGKALARIRRSFDIGEEAAMTVTLQEDDPGNGKIGDILTFVVDSVSGANLTIEVFAKSENRPPSAIYVEKLTESS